MQLLGSAALLWAFKTAEGSQGYKIGLFFSVHNNAQS